MIRNCGLCSISFDAKTAEVNRGRAKFCSPECRHRYQSIIMRGRKMKPEAKRKLIKALTGRVRTKEHSQNISKALMGKFAGEKNFNWKGGMYKGQGRNYIRVYNHPNSHKSGYILNSRYVVEQSIGRYLKPEEHIHHINFVKDDDRLENLFIFPTESEHTRYHQLLKVSKTDLITESNLSSYK